MFVSIDQLLFLLTIDKILILSYVDLTYFVKYCIQIN